MFTGIVTAIGTIRELRDQGDLRVVIACPYDPAGIAIGASIACSGCCLTVVKLAAKGKQKLVRFDLLMETWERTNLQFARPGSLVNLERPLRTDGSLGGHFVTGHIDGVGKIKIDTEP